MKLFTSGHRGVSLVELLIFLAILGIVAVLILPLLFTANQTKLQQQTVAAVEQNGAQIIQDVATRVRAAERILSPLTTKSGAFLALQTASGAGYPMIIGLLSGSLVLVEGSQKHTLTSSEVGIADFKVRNTSVSANKQSVVVGFHLARATRQAPHDTYMKYFETAFSLFPADQPVGNPCNCAAPSCAGKNSVTWQVCIAGACSNRNTGLQCP